MPYKRYGSRILAEGVEISNDTRITGLNNNDIILGKSGCGKTGGYVIPNIQNIDSSLVVSDTKGQLSRSFTRILQEKGYDVMTLDFINPEKSCGYNPMKNIRIGKDGSPREKDILTLARTIVPSLDKTEPFWEQSAANYIAFLIAYCLEAEPEECHNLPRVCELNRVFITDEIKFVDWLHWNPDSIAHKRYTLIKASNSADRMWASIMGFVNLALEPFDFREAKGIFANKKNFDLRSLGRKKSVLFINTSDTDNTFDVISRIFYTQLFQVLCEEADKNRDGRLKVPVRIILDDFAASARIMYFDKVISVIRSRDIYVSIILQSLSQLNTMYGDYTATTILNNCDHIIYMGNQDMATARYVADRANKTADAILQLPAEKSYLITAGEKAQLVNKVIPYSTIQ